MKGIKFDKGEEKNIMEPTRKSFIESILGDLSFDNGNFGDPENDPAYEKSEHIEEKGENVLVTTTWRHKTLNKQMVKHLIDKKRNFYKGRIESIPYLKSDLEIALQNEDYLQAAKLRDELKILEEKKKAKDATLPDFL